MTHCDEKIKAIIEDLRNLRELSIIDGNNALKELQQTWHDSEIETYSMAIKICQKHLEKSE